jgi:hypothetical protein
VFWLGFWLKLNFVSRLPTVVTDEIKSLYKKYIEDCYKKSNNIINKTVKHGQKHSKIHGQKQGKTRGQKHGQKHGQKKGKSKF